MSVLICEGLEIRKGNNNSKLTESFSHIISYDMCSTGHLFGEFFFFYLYELITFIQMKFFSFFFFFSSFIFIFFPGRIFKVA